VAMDVLEWLWLWAGALVWLSTLVVGLVALGTVLSRRAALAERQNHAAHARLLAASERAVAVEDGAALVWCALTTRTIIRPPASSSLALLLRTRRTADVERLDGATRISSW
jgi:hypothetical protein